MSKDKLFEYLEKSGVTAAKEVVPETPAPEVDEPVKEPVKEDLPQEEPTDVNPPVQENIEKDEPIKETPKSTDTGIDYKELIKSVSDTEQDTNEPAKQESPKWKEFFETEDEYIDYKLRKAGSDVTPLNINKMTPKELVLNKLKEEYKDFGMSLKDAEEYLEQKYDKTIDEIFDSKLILIKEATEAKEFYNNRFNSYKEPVQSAPVQEAPKPQPKRENTQDWVQVSKALMSDDRQRVLKPYGEEFEYTMDEEHVKKVPEIMATMAKNYNLDLTEENIVKLKKVIDDQYILDNLAKIDKVRISDLEAKLEEKYRTRTDNPSLNRQTRPVQSDKKFVDAAKEFFKR